MRCPKCDSPRWIPAPDEAPAWAKQWMKCFACGNRWNADGPPPGSEDEDDELEESDEPAPIKLGGDDLVSRVMNVARNHPATQKRQRQPDPDKAILDQADAINQRVTKILKEEEQKKKEKAAMKGKICTKKNCEAEAAEDSVMCPHHRDIKKRANQNYHPGGPKNIDPKTGKRPYHRHKPLNAPSPVAQLPAKRANAPIVMAEPTQINPPAPSANGHEHEMGLPAVYALITQFETDLAALRRTKEIMERHA